MVLQQASRIREQEKPIIAACFPLQYESTLIQRRVLKCHTSASVQASHVEDMFLDTWQSCCLGIMEISCSIFSFSSHSGRGLFTYVLS
jgi:hypothetical protein